MYDRSIHFYGVHGTCMTNQNTLISGDNKGYAAMQMEEYMNNVVNTSGFDSGPSTSFSAVYLSSASSLHLPGRGPFVAAFVQTNHADASPNIAGPFCPDHTPCEPIHSTCAKRDNSEGCVRLSAMLTFLSARMVDVLRLFA